ncbi:MAG: DUF5674 family protein [Candidatus Aminicenantes bacterium]|nr:DUF5674 family protein [Candidatus Aminicenantes bacterium]
MKIIDAAISLSDLKHMAQNGFGNMVKALFDSMINIRPSQGNRSRGVENPESREKIVRVVNRLIKS